MKPLSLLVFCVFKQYTDRAAILGCQTLQFFQIVSILHTAVTVFFERNLTRLRFGKGNLTLVFLSEWIVSHCT